MRRQVGVGLHPQPGSVVSAALFPDACLPQAAIYIEHGRMCVIALHVNRRGQCIPLYARMLNYP
jgi:hypothetical protein